MVVGLATIDLYLPDCTSLKDKRKNIKSIVERVKNKFNVSIIEAGNHDLWQRAVLGIAYVAPSPYQAKKCLRGIERFIEILNKATILKTNISLFSPEE